MKQAEFLRVIDEENPNRKYTTEELSMLLDGVSSVKARHLLDEKAVKKVRHSSTIQ